MNIRYPIYEGVYRILTCHENKGIYRQDSSEQMGTDHRIGLCSLHRVQLYVHTGHIPRVGCGSHRVF